MAKILIAGQSDRTRQVLRTLLAPGGHDVEEVRDGRDAWRAYVLNRPDVVVLDVVLPSLGGYDVCREIRRGDSMTAILFLSDRGEESDKVLGLELGADDYVTVPFGLCELRARVNALLRRRGASNFGSCNPGLVFGLGRYTVNGRELVLDCGGRAQVGISEHEYALLQYFTSHPNEVARRRDLLEFAWGRGVFSYSRTIDTHVCTLRRKIAGSGCRIETVCGVGYRLRLSESAA